MMQPGDDLLRIIRGVVRRELGDPRGVVRLHRATVAAIDESIRTCSVHVGGAPTAIPGVRWFTDDPTPAIGDEVMVTQDLGGRYVVMGRVQGTPIPSAAELSHDQQHDHSLEADGVALSPRSIQFPTTVVPISGTIHNLGAQGRNVVRLDPTAGLVMSDDFDRTLASGWGQASGGGWYDLSAADAQFKVQGGAGVIVNTETTLAVGLYPGQREVAGGGTEYTTEDGGVEIQDQEVYHWFDFDTDASVLGDHIVYAERLRAQRDDDQDSGTSPNPTDDHYQLRYRINQNTGALEVRLFKQVSGSSSAIHGSWADTGLSPTAGQKWWVRAQADGVSPTTLRFRAWLDGTSEPGWEYETTDSEAVLQDTGGIGWSLQGSDPGAVHRYGTLRVKNLGTAGAFEITGIADGWTQSAPLWLLNPSASSSVALKHENAGSQAANRLSLPGSVDYTIAANAAAMLIYDRTDQRWRVAG